MSEDQANDKVTVQFSLSGALPLSTRLARDAPAANEGPPQAWKLAQEVIDHAAYLLDTINTVGAGRQVRDLVLSALLRRAITTAEGARTCLYHSLEEPAIVLLRTLLEVELNMRLVTADDSQGMAKRLAAFHHLKAKRHVTQVLGHREVQEGDADFKTFMKDAGRRQKEYFSSAAFDDVRDELVSSQHWHGHKTLKDAFESVGGGTDYLHLYDSFSPFVHVANLDHDFVDIVDEKPHMRALAQRDPRRIQNYLQGCVLNMCRIMELYVADKGAEEYSSSFTVTFDSGEQHQISPLAALQQSVIAIWGAANGWSIGEEEEASPDDG